MSEASLEEQPLVYSWSQPICDDCWDDRNPGRRPVRFVGAVDRCCHCEGDTNGIYVRVDPKTVRFPQSEEALDGR